MTRRAPDLVSQLEQLIEFALAPGSFVSWNADFAFVGELESVERRIAGLLSTEPGIAVSLYEAFLAGCNEKAEEVDDSSGSFGQFVGELYCGWIKARQAAGADPTETARRLLEWMDDDPYGFCHRLETEAVKVMSKAGLSAFEKQVRARLDSATSPRVGDEFRQPRDHQRWRSAKMLRAIYLAARNVAAYAELCEATELTATDCHALATMLVARRRPAEALGWIERGLAIVKAGGDHSMSDHELAGYKRTLLTKLGRANEALEAAWADFRAHPSTYSYQDLMKYGPKGERPSWHTKAIEAAKAADLHSLLELLVETKEVQRLADLVGKTKDAALEGVSHYATEPAAKCLERSHPGLAARLWCAQGMRVVNEGKSRYYTAALSNFERARDCFERAGQTADWIRVVTNVRSQHRRKTGFMAGFEKVVAGMGPSQRPSFLERAKARWGARRSQRD